MIIACDLDGVIFNSPFLGFFKRINLDYFIYRNLRKVNILKKIFYQLTRTNIKMVEILRRLAESGRNKIIIISGHSQECREEVVNCLKKYGIPFNKLYLCLEGDKPLHFKLKKIVKERCDFYVEDQEKIVRFLKKHLKRCQVVHYKSHNFLLELKTLLKL